MRLLRVVGRGRRPWLLALLVASLYMAAVPTGTARASIGGCRSDPVVILSNGVVLDLSAAIDDTVDDVRGTTYTLHAPVGTGVVAVVGTDGVLGLTEHFVFQADQAASTYATETVVRTGRGGVAVTATTDVVGVDVGVGAARTGTAAGVSAQSLQVTLAP